MLHSIKFFLGTSISLITVSLFGDVLFPCFIVPKSWLASLLGISFREEFAGVIWIINRYFNRHAQGEDYRSRNILSGIF